MLTKRIRSFNLTRILYTASLAAFIFTGAITWTFKASAVTIFSDSFAAGTGSPAYTDFGDAGGAPLTGFNGWVSSGADVIDIAVDRIHGTAGDNVQGDLPLPDGQALYVYETGVSVSNTLAATTVAGTTYTLSARIGAERTDAFGYIPASLTLSLYINGNALPATTISGTPLANSGPGYVFQSLTAAPYVATGSLESIEIRMSGASTTGGFDRTIVDLVQLNAEAVPEPSTFVLAALGLAGLGLLAWRRRK